MVRKAIRIVPESLSFKRQRYSALYKLFNDGDGGLTHSEKKRIVELLQLCRSECRYKQNEEDE